MVMQEGQQQALYGCGGGGVGGWGGVAAFISAAAAGADAGEEVGENRPIRRQPSKQKKTPQRGLGVAQLEKIRLEEQQSGAAVDVVTSGAGPSLPGPFSTAMPLPPLPLPSTPFAGDSDLNPSPGTRPAIPIPSAPFCDLLQVPAAPAAPDAPGGHGFLPPLLWNPLEVSLHGAEAASNCKAFSFPISLSEEYSSNTIWQHQHWQQQSKHCPMPNSPVNPAVTPLPLSGAKLRNHMEPPSNQSSAMSKPASPLWPGDEKPEMARLKRPWPFHLDAMADYTRYLPCTLPLPPLPFPPAPDEQQHSPAMNAGCNLLDFKPAGSAGLRVESDGAGAPSSAALFQADGRSCSYGNPPEKRCKERSSSTTAPVYGDFLTLGVSLPPPPAPKLKQCTGSTLRLSQLCQEPSSSVPAPAQYHGTTDDDASLRYGADLQLPFYSFLPMRSSNKEASLAESRHEDVGSIDLNLKL